MTARCPSCGQYMAKRAQTMAKLKREVKRGRRWKLFRWIIRRGAAKREK